jgi:hypothetical protein
MIRKANFFCLPMYHSYNIKCKKIFQPSVDKAHITSKASDNASTKFLKKKE